MTREWKDNIAASSEYYYQVNNGLIVGQVYNLAHSQIWGAKIPVSATEEHIIGNFVSLEFAKKAVEDYWGGKDKTIDYMTRGLITQHEL